MESANKPSALSLVFANNFKSSIGLNVTVFHNNQMEEINFGLKRT